MKAYSGGITELVISAVGGDEFSASRLHRFTPGEMSPGHLLNRRLGGLQRRSGSFEEVKNFLYLLGIQSPFP
jgi:hypothetical protein